VLLISRAISVYLIFWVITDVISLPGELNSFLHHLDEHRRIPASVLAGDSHARALEGYWLRTYLFALAANVLRIALWLCAAGWFYRCGPRIQRFFGVSRNGEPNTTSPAPNH
jgi:hypothetical protein